MDENHSEAKDILRKRILEEKRTLLQPENPDSSEKEPGLVYQSHESNTLNDNISLFHSDEDILPDFEAKEPGDNSVFSSENTSLHPQALFQSNQDIEEDGSSTEVEPAASEDSADTAFPLFLSFKANDSMQTVSEGVREKYSDRADKTLNEPAESGSFPAESNMAVPYAESPVTSVSNQDISDMNYPENGIPIFKPFNSSLEESLQPTYDIPKVFPNNGTVSGPASPKAVSSAPGTAPAVRPGASYTAAQQMGNIVPLSQREFKSKKTRTQSHKPLYILLLSITILVAVFSFWSNLQFDGAFSKFFGSAEVTKSTTQSTSLSAATAASTGTKETAAQTSKETTTAVTKPKPTATPAPAQTTATAAETTATAAETTAASTANITSAMIPSGFSTSITDGKSSGDTATFNILFKNLGSSDVSLFDGVEFITISFTTDSVKITEVTSPDFTFTADPDKTNYYIGTPVSTSVINRKDTQTVAVTAKSNGVDIGKYSVKYYVKCYS